MEKRTVEVIIPTWKPDGRFEKLIGRLQKQTVKPDCIRVVNTERDYWLHTPLGRAFEQGEEREGTRLSLVHIPQEAFDHGGTRVEAAATSQADILLFMTQDALPADRFLIERLICELGDGSDGTVAAAYARQLPNPDCGVIERYTRGFNYGADRAVKSAEDLPRLGIKTYMCSNVCAAYVRRAYEKAGGFERRTIFNEDMILAARMIRKGYRIAYAAGARVFHSHNYSGAQQFHRNFDLAVSQAEHPEIFEGVRSESEGIRLVKDTARYLTESGHVLQLPALVWQSGCKYLGYLLGKHYRRLPDRAVVFCSMNKNYWKNKHF